MADWHLDKKVSLAMVGGLIVNLMVSTYGVVWNQAKQDSRIQQLELRPDLTERVIRLEILVAGQNTILTKMEGTLSRLDNTISRIDREQARRKSIIDNAEKHFSTKK